jgi:hypothetical protein
MNYSCWVSSRRKGTSSPAEIRNYGEAHGMTEGEIQSATAFLQKAGEDGDLRYSIPRRLEYAVFPIIALRRTGEGPVGPVNANPQVQGTATMLSEFGLFCTAGHCVNTAFGDPDITGQNAHDPNDYALLVFESTQRVFKIAMVTELSISNEFDLAVGRAEKPGQESNYPTTLGVGSAILGASSQADVPSQRLEHEAEFRQQKAEVARHAGAQAAKNLEVDLLQDGEGRPAYVMFTPGSVRRTFGPGRHAAAVAAGGANEIALVSLRG